MPGPSNRIVVDDFNDYLKDLSATMGPLVSFRKIVKSEASAVLSKASEKTKKAKASKIDKRYNIRSSTKTTQKKGPLTQNPELIPYVTIRGKKYPTSGKYYPRPLFEEIKKKLEFYNKRAKDRMYSGKATWLLVARKAKLSTKRFPAKASLEKAIAAQGGKYALNSTENGTQNKVPFRFNVTIVNGATCALNKAARGVFAIKSAMGGRKQYYRTNMTQGAFQNAADRAKAYPGVYVDE